MITEKDFSIILSCAEIYEKELVNSNVLFVYLNRKTKEYECFETTFLASNFKHLTGVIYPYLNDVNKRGDNIDGATHFFNLALKKKVRQKKM